MGSRLFHQNKAKRNKEFLALIDCRKYPDWAVTVAFYVGVHLVESLLAQYRGGYHSRGYKDRENTLRTCFPAIFAEFNPLYNQSRIARYLDEHISAKSIEEKSLGERLPKLEKLVGAEIRKLAPKQRARR